MTGATFTIVRDGDPVPARLRGGAVAIGNFDGMHRGHRAVLERVIGAARERGVASLALTFEPHPRAFFRPDVPLFRLTGADVKAELMRRIGLDAVVEATFDSALASTAAEDFVETVLVARLAPSLVVVGYDFHFGRGRAGSPELLAELGRRRGFDVTVVGPAGEGDDVWSATSVREALQEGRVEEANHILGYPWFVRGEVIHGARRGRELGFPTANIRLDAGVGLRHGVYAVRMRIGDDVCDGVASFGRRPQFDNGAPLLEVFLFDVAPDLYGRVVDVEFVSFIRPELRFGGVDDLVARMHEDAAEARRLLAADTEGSVPASGARA